MNNITHHTPGPWRVTHHAQLIKVESASRVICDGFRNEAANAHLIAAAPELLESLRAMVREFGLSENDLDPEISTHRPIIKALAAIAKAEGAS